MSHAHLDPLHSWNSNYFFLKSFRLLLLTLGTLHFWMLKVIICLLAQSYRCQVITWNHSFVVWSYYLTNFCVTSQLSDVTDNALVLACYGQHVKKSTLYLLLSHTFIHSSTLQFTRWNFSFFMSLMTYCWMTEIKTL